MSAYSSTASSDVKIEAKNLLAERKTMLMTAVIAML